MTYSCATLAHVYARRRPRSRACVACIIARLARAAFSLSNGGKAIVPDEAADALGRINPRFSTWRQDDAQEYVIELLDAIERDVASSSLPPCNLMKGTYVSRITCSVCHGISDTVDPIETLSLEINGVDSVTAALKRFTAVERLEGDNAYACERCKRKTTATKKIGLVVPPQILIVHLKRFSFRSFGASKLFHTVGFVNKLNLGPSLMDLNEAQLAAVTASAPDALTADGSVVLEYELCSVLEHSGDSAHSGHYFTFARAGMAGPEEMGDSFEIGDARGFYQHHYQTRGEEQLRDGTIVARQRWYELDDEDVRPVHGANHKQQAYMLAYRLSSARDHAVATALRVRPSDARGGTEIGTAVSAAVVAGGVTDDDVTAFPTARRVLSSVPRQTTAVSTVPQHVPRSVRVGPLPHSTSAAAPSTAVVVASHTTTPSGPRVHGALSVTSPPTREAALPLIKPLPRPEPPVLAAQNTRQAISSPDGRHDGDSALRNGPSDMNSTMSSGDASSGPPHATHSELLPPHRQQVAAQCARAPAPSVPNAQLAVARLPLESRLLNPAQAARPPSSILDRTRFTVPVIASRPRVPQASAPRHAAGPIDASDYFSSPALTGAPRTAVSGGAPQSNQAPSRLFAPVYQPGGAAADVRSLECSRVGDGGTSLTMASVGRGEKRERSPSPNVDAARRTNVARIDGIAATLQLLQQDSLQNGDHGGGTTFPARAAVVARDNSTAALSSASMLSAASIATPVTQQSQPLVEYDEDDE